MPATETKLSASNTKAPRPERSRLSLRWLRRGPNPARARVELPLDRRARFGLRDNGFNPAVFFSACPALRLRDDDSTHAPYVTAAHRCGCAPDYTPDSVHQIVFCLTDSAHTTCPRFDQARVPRPVDDGALSQRPSAPAKAASWRAPLGVAVAALALIGVAITAALTLPGSGEASPRVAAAGESAAVTPVAAALDVVSPDIVSPDAVPPPSVTTRTPAAASAPFDDGAAALAAYYGSVLDPLPTGPGSPLRAPEPISYVVAPGDSLLAIAADFGIELETLLEANALTIDDPIIIGQLLAIPEGDRA